MGLTEVVRRILEGFGAELSQQPSNGYHPHVTPAAERDKLVARAAIIQQKLKEQLGQKAAS